MITLWISGPGCYYRLWDPRFFFFLLASIFYELSKILLPEPLPWEGKHEQASIKLKQVLQEIPALGLPNYSNPFICACKEEPSPGNAYVALRNKQKPFGMTACN